MSWFARSGDATRVLVFNFFAGIKPRGIPVYARELEACFQRVGVAHRELRAPRWVGLLPSALQNALFVFFEQLVAPIAARCMGCRLTVYAYNSGSLLDALTGRSILVIHDFIPNRRDASGLAARYIKVCQAWHAWMGGPVAVVSRHTMRQIERVRRYRRCEKFLWANPFYAFEAALARPRQRARRQRQGLSILLCSGAGSNKDFRGALRLLRDVPLEESIEVRVLGFGDEAHLARRRLALLPPAWRDRVSVLPRLNLEATVQEFSDADLVWVHSRAEGFGRPVMEARMCGRPVLATDIGAFRQMRRFRHLHLYRDETFPEAFRQALGEARMQGCPAASAESFNRQLEQEVTRLLKSLELKT
ncbi:glycosyltransferase [Ideonella sp. YS5]|uniref:glycosyltransferase n=1 Tax=Ideonella sp. YS5 TaxID=3453714 RepID=UPI003EEE7288